MGRNFDLICYYCGENPHFNKLIACIGWGPGGLRLTALFCTRCGIGEYIPDHGRVVCMVTA